MDDILDAEVFASLAPARGKNQTSGRSCHTCTEAMALGTLPIVGLVSSLHGSSLVRSYSGAKSDDYTYASMSVSTRVDPFVKAHISYSH